MTTIGTMTFLLFIALLAQCAINLGQVKKNKAMTDYICSSNKEFDRIEEILKEFQIKKQEVENHEKKKKEWYDSYGHHKDYEKNKTDNVAKEIGGGYPNPDFTQTIQQAIVFANMIE